MKSRLLKRAKIYHAWHGGGMVEKDSPAVTYYTENKEMAQSYADSKEGTLHAVNLELSSPAPWEEIKEAALLLGFPEEEIDMYTPASIFDASLFGVSEVRSLVRNLKSMGYDCAILTDIGMGVQIEDEAIVVFN